MCMQTDGAGEEGGLKVSPHRLHRGPISPKEVEEASRILFAPTNNTKRPAAAGAAVAATTGSAGGSVEGSYEDIGRGGVHDDGVLDAGADEAAAVPPPMFRGGGRSRGGGVGGLSSLASATPTAPLQVPNTSAASSSSSSSAAGPPQSAASSLVGQLHPRPAVHEEILRFGMALAANPRIQSVIREELEQRQHAAVEAGGGVVVDAEGEYEEYEEEEGGVDGMESAMRRLCGGLAALEGEEAAEEASWFGAAAAAGGGGGGSGSISSFLTASYEMVGLLGASASASGGGPEEEGGSWAVGAEPPGASFLSLGRSIRRHDCVLGGSANANDGAAQGQAAAAGPEVSEEVLDELLRSDDEDDAITQRMFATTPDEHVRRYLRNLDLECVIW